MKIYMMKIYVIYMMMRMKIALEILKISTLLIDFLNDFKKF